ncbi:ABC transporter permease [Chloroflexota bacterium]
MIADILTVMWKERKGLFRHRGSRTRSVMTMLLPAVIFSIYVPWDAGTRWLDGSVSILASVAIPVVLIGVTIPDSFAGERERHTLGTLLASRLPDNAILIGKVAMSVGLAWGATLIVLLISMGVVNVVHWQGEILLYSGSTALADLGMSLLVAILASSAGVLISLRVTTVQEATQTLMAGLTVVPLILGMVALFVAKMQPKWAEPIKDALGALGFTKVILIIMVFLTVISVELLVAAIARFQRARLIEN